MVPTHGANRSSGWQAKFSAAALHFWQESRSSHFRRRSFTVGPSLRRRGAQRREAYWSYDADETIVGWDQRATRAPAHHWLRSHRWAGAAYQPLVPPYDSTPRKYIRKSLSASAANPSRRSGWTTVKSHRLFVMTTLANHLQRSISFLLHIHQAGREWPDDC